MPTARAVPMPRVEAVHQVAQPPGRAIVRLVRKYMHQRGEQPHAQVGEVIENFISRFGHADLRLTIDD